MIFGFRAAPGAVTVINVLTSVCSSILVECPCILVDA